MPRRTKEEAEQTRKHLLNTALRLFASQGIARTSLKDVAAAAELTHGALYWHFRNKTDLLEALYKECRLNLDDIYLDQLQSARQNALDSLAGFIYEWSLKVVEDQHSADIWRLFHTDLQQQPELASLRPQIKEEQQEWLNYLNKFVKKARKQELIAAKSGRSDPIAVSALALVMGISACANTLEKDQFSLKFHAKQTVATFINGLRLH